MSNPSTVDGVPSVTQQGYSVHLLKSPIGGFNAGMVRDESGQILLLTRAVEYIQVDGNKRLRFKLVWQKPNDDGTMSPEIEMELPGFDPTGHAEDPRIFEGAPGRFLCFGHSTDDIDRPPTIRLAKLDHLHRGELLPIIPYAGNGTKGHPQKNWQFFFRGERLFCVYWSFPHKVIEVDPETGAVLNEWEDPQQFVWQWGPISGGTPPIEWQGQMLSFYHGYMPHPTRRRRYYMGAYCFEKNAPFRITKITRPLLRGSRNDPTNYDPPNHAGLPLVVFPCGCLLEKDDPDACTVSMGVNDSYSAIATFDLRDLPWETPEQLKAVKTFHFFTQDVSVPPRASQSRSLEWTRVKGGGVLATDNPVAIDDCVTRGNVAEISPVMFDAMIQGGDGPAVPPPPVSSLIADVMHTITATIPRLPGWCSVERACEFASVITMLRPAVSVDLGVYGGRGAIAMGLAHKAIGCGVCVAVDPWSAEESIKGEVKENAEWWGRLNHEELYQGVLAAVSAFRLESFVEVVRRTSDLADLPLFIGLLSIDGNHTEQAIRDAERWGPMVTKGGFVYMDDVDWVGGNVHRAISHLVDHLGFKLLHRRDTGVWLQRQ